MYQPPPAPEVDLTPENLRRLMMGEPIGPRPYLPGKEEAVRRRMEQIAADLKQFNDKECRVAVYTWEPMQSERYTTLLCTYADDRAAERVFAGTNSEGICRRGIAICLSHTAPLAALMGGDMTIKVADSSFRSLGGVQAESVEKFPEPAPPPCGWEPLVARIRHVLRPLVHTLTREEALTPLTFKSRVGDRKHNGFVFDAVFPFD